MQESHTPLSYLRSRSPATKHTIAVLGALLPALLVGYGQYYMRDKEKRALATAPKKIEVKNTEEVSVFAAFGKILSEGKAAVGDAASAVKKFNQAYLNESVPTQQEPVIPEARTISDESTALIKKNK